MYRVRNIFEYPSTLHAMLRKLSMSKGVPGLGLEGFMPSFVA
jgi:hypothetical protein